MSVSLFHVHRLTGIHRTLILIAATAAVLAIAPVTAHATRSPGCKDPVRDFNATADDGRDDRSEFELTIAAAIAAQVDVCIPAGTFDLTRKPGAGSVHSLKITGTVRITGEGRDVTKLRMLGSGMTPGGFPGNWRLIDIRDGATGVVIADLALDGSHRVDTGEQTHLLHLTGPTSQTRVERVTLTLPSLTPPAHLVDCSAKYEFGGAYCTPGTAQIEGFYGGGDCTRFLGDPGKIVEGTVLLDVRAENCDRAAFSLQRGVNTLLIQDSVGVCFKDQALDFEPSEGVNAPITNITVRGTLLSRGAVDATGLTAVIGGTTTLPADHVLIEDSEIRGGALEIIGVRNVMLKRVLVNSGTVSDTPTIYIRNVAEDIQIIDSEITRPASAPPRELIFVSHGTQAPQSVRIKDTQLTQLTAKAVVHLASARRFTIVGGSVRTVASSEPIIFATAVIADMADVTLAGVAVASAGSPGLLLITGYRTYHVARAVIHDTVVNGILNTGYGVKYEIGTDVLPPLANPSITGSTFRSPQHTCTGYTGGGCVP
jgi:hypothetical protein